MRIPLRGSDTAPLRRGSIPRAVRSGDESGGERKPPEGDAEVFGWGEFLAASPVAVVGGRGAGGPAMEEALIGRGGGVATGKAGLGVEGGFHVKVRMA